VALAVAIARDGARHARLRQHLRDGAWQRTLGDVETFTRNLEASLVRVHLPP
jgi:predicted O-linked N-acetylglucosamine transferase (SPINDLY family)